MAARKGRRVSKAHRPTSTPAPHLGGGGRVRERPGVVGSTPRQRAVAVDAFVVVVGDEPKGIHGKGVRACRGLLVFFCTKTQTISSLTRPVPPSNALVHVLGCQDAKLVVSEIADQVVALDEIGAGGGPNAAACKGAGRLTAWM